MLPEHVSRRVPIGSQGAISALQSARLGQAEYRQGAVTYPLSHRSASTLKQEL